MFALPSHTCGTSLQKDFVGLVILSFELAVTLFLIKKSPQSLDRKIILTASYL